jgi:hypothetical protein
MMEEMHLTETMERLSAAIEQLEETVRATSAANVAASVQAEETIGKIVATVETREVELERKLAESEEKIAALSAAANVGGRKTVSRMMAKGNGSVEGMDAGTIDAALTSLTVEQRIAVKSELMRAGLV